MMENKRERKQKRHINAMIWKVAYGVYDILVSYLSFFFAIAIRFYANGEFHAEASLYLKPFNSFAPIYAVIVLVVFVCFGLYSGRWKYAGYHDFSKILEANIITAIIQIAATKLFYIDMPLSYYCIGSLLQFIFVLFSRFAHRLMDAATERIKRKVMASINVMIVGDGDTAVFTRRILEGNNVNNVYVKCFFSENCDSSDTMIDGIPVEGSIDELEKAVLDYKIDFVCIADPLINKELTGKIKDICGKLNVEVRNLPDITYFDEFLEL